MEKTNKTLRKLLPVVLMAAGALFSTPMDTSAQTFFKTMAGYPTRNSAGSIRNFSNSSQQTEWINCDAYAQYDQPSGLAGKRLIAIAWDELDPVFSLMKARFYITAPSGDELITSLPLNTKHPDIVIGDDTRSGAKPGDCIVNIVYERDTNVYLSQYSIVRTDYLALSMLSVTFLKDTQLSVTAARKPHIDMYHDTAAYTLSMSGVWGMGRDWNNFVDQPLSKFCITWTEGDKVMVASGDNKDAKSSLMVGAPDVLVTADTSIVSDVACQVNTDTMSANYGEATAYITYNLGNVIFVADWNPDTKTVGSLMPVYNYMQLLSPPRIEAINNNNRNVGTNIHWELVLGDLNMMSTSPMADIIRVQGAGNPVTSYVLDYAAYDGLGTPGLISPADQINHAYDPVIMAGCGPVHSSYLMDSGPQAGNQWYYTGWRIMDNTYASLPSPGPYGSGDTYDFYALQDDNMAAGNNPGEGYNLINNNVLSPVTPFIPKLALGTSSNAGSDLLATWSDGTGNLLFQHVTTANIFKTTTPGKYNTGNATAIRVLPNPNNGQLDIAGISSQADYTITDMAGRVLLKGKVSPAGKHINASGLPNGTYFLQLDENRKISNARFVKQ